MARHERSAERILVTKKINKKKPLNNVVEQVDNQISNLAAGEFASLSKGAQAPDSLECIICRKETRDKFKVTISSSSLLVERVGYVDRNVESGQIKCDILHRLMFLAGIA